VLAACNVDFDAAVDCYGEYVVGARPEGMFPFQVTNIVDQLPRLRAPLLGLFGKEDNYPSPEQVAELDEILDEENKPHEFHSYDHAGHAFFAVDDSSYRVAAASGGWERITAFSDAHLKGSACRGHPGGRPSPRPRPPSRPPDAGERQGFVRLGGLMSRG
jgi:carboxymethylenebutenolidase